VGRAEVANLVPETAFIAGIDQSSFLLAEDGQSNRRAIHYFLGGQLAAVRIDEWKGHVYLQDPYAYTQSGYQGGLTGSISRAATVMLFNLYTNPQENDSVAIRHIPVLNVLVAEFAAFEQKMRTYPPSVRIGF
jgi:arylsulfatase